MDEDFSSGFGRVTDALFPLVTVPTNAMEADQPRRSLLDLITEIKSRAKSGDDHTLETAMLYRELRSRVENGEAGKGVKWYEWAIKHIHLKPTRLREFEVIATSPNPRAALDELRKQNCDRQRRFRERAETRARESDPERLSVVQFAKTAHIEDIRKIRKHIGLLESMRERSRTSPAANIFDRTQ